MDVTRQQQLQNDIAATFAESLAGHDWAEATLFLLEVGSTSRVWVDALDAAGGAKQAATAEQLVKQLGQMLGDHAARNASIEAAEQVVARLGGALERTLAALEPYLLQMRLETGTDHA